MSSGGFFFLFFGNERTNISRRIRTQDVHHGETVVESEADEKSAQRELPETAGQGGRDARQEAGDVGADQRRYSAVSVGDPSEDQAAEDRADEEDALGGCRQRAVLAYPI